MTRQLIAERGLSIAYYLAIIKAAYVDDGRSIEPVEVNAGLASTLSVCMVGVVGVCLFFSPVTAFLGLR